jgi:hypothetical protein
MSELFTTTQPLPGIKTCSYEFLPAFATEAALGAFAESCCSVITEKWLCTVCNNWHYLGAPKPPSGASSGTGRLYRQPAPRYRRERLLLADAGPVNPEDEYADNFNL